MVEKVGGVRPLRKFTLPGGGPVYIVAAKVTGLTRAIPHQHHPNAHAIIVSREGRDPGSGNARSRQRSAA